MRDVWAPDLGGGGSALLGPHLPRRPKSLPEWASVLGITFHLTTLEGQQGGPVCRQPGVYYPTAGGEICMIKTSADHLKGLSDMFGISRTHCLTAEGLDVGKMTPRPF